MFFHKTSTKHKAPNGGCRSTPPSDCKKNIKTLGFFEKSPKPKKLLNHSVGTRRVAEVRPSKRDGRTSFISVSLPFHQGTGSIFFENLHPKPLTPFSLYKRQYQFYFRKSIIDSIKEKIISIFSRTLMILTNFFNKLIFTT